MSRNAPWLAASARSRWRLGRPIARPSNSSARKDSRPSRSRCASGSLPNETPGRFSLWRENRVLDLIADFKVDARGDAAVDLEDRVNRPPGRDLPLRQRLRVGGDIHHHALARNEDHVQRDVGVLHPEGDWPLFLEVEQHAAIRGHVTAEHQAALAARFVVDDLDGEAMLAAGGDDFELVEALRRRADDRRKKKREARNEAETPHRPGGVKERKGQTFAPEFSARGANAPLPIAF